MDIVKTHPKIALLDFGFTKATTMLGEMGNMMGDVGAEKIAELLRTNSVLRSLDLVHNNIGQVGLNSIHTTTYPAIFTPFELNSDNNERILKRFLCAPFLHNL